MSAPPERADLITSLADYCQEHGMGETREEAVEKLEALCDHDLRAFADAVMAEVVRETVETRIRMR